MTTKTERAAQAAQQRAASAASTVDRALSMTMRTTARPLELRAAGKESEVVLAGLASRTGTEYEMHDLFGPYQEVVAAGAFGATLAADPQVVLTVNHLGLGLASTGAGTLRLDETDDGLTYTATLALDDPDVQALVSKVERGSVTESSMMFWIREAHWSDDLTTRTITEIDLHRGDVAAVMYGANPHTSVEVTERRSDAPPDQRRFDRPVAPAEVRDGNAPQPSREALESELAKLRIDLMVEAAT